MHTARGHEQYTGSLCGQNHDGSKRGEKKKHCLSVVSGSELRQLIRLTQFFSLTASHFFVTSVQSTRRGQKIAAAAERQSPATNTPNSTQSHTRAQFFRAGPLFPLKRSLSPALSGQLSASCQPGNRTVSAGIHPDATLPW